MPLHMEMRLFVKGRISMGEEGVVKLVSSLPLSLSPSLTPNAPHKARRGALWLGFHRMGRALGRGLSCLSLLSPASLSLSLPGVDTLCDAIS